jgi:hypothetical protein
MQQLAMLNKPTCQDYRSKITFMQTRSKWVRLQRAHSPQVARRQACPSASGNTPTPPLVVDGVQYTLSEAGERLKLWIIENGGIVHPSLAVVENAPSGSTKIKRKLNETPKLEPNRDSFDKKQYPFAKESFSDARVLSQHSF